MSKVCERTGLTAMVVQFRHHVFAFMLIALASCATTPNLDPNTDLEHEFMLARIPIHQFGEYDPYPPNYSGGINAYVQFQKDGVVRASLGCKIMSGTYRFPADETVMMTGETGIIRPDYDDATCSPELIELETSLADFLESRPKIHKRCNNGCFRILRHDGVDLDLRSVADVLELD
ncbi:MAG: hypothetical protein AAF768_03880 [Pseudomonadota bacterium]